MKRIFIILTLGLALLAEDTGGRAGKFMLLGSSPRAVGMGQGMTAIDNMPEAFSYNPAALIGIQGYQVGGSYQTLALDRSTYSAYIAGNIKNDAAFAISWVHAGTDIQGRNGDGIPTGDLENGDDNIGIVFSKKVLRYLAFGGSLRYMQSKLHEMLSYTAGFDVGLIYRHRQTGLNAGVSVANIAMNHSWNSSELYGEGYNADEAIPLTVRTGVAWRPEEKPYTAAVDLEITEDRDPRIHGGLSYVPIQYLQLRAGMDHTSPTAGLSVNIPIGDSWTGYVDYAISGEKYGLPPKHLFGLRVMFK